MIQHSFMELTKAAKDDFVDFHLAVINIISRKSNISQVLVIQQLFEGVRCTGFKIIPHK